MSFYPKIIKNNKTMPPPPYNTDTQLPEVLTIIFLLLGIILFVYFSPYLSLRSFDPENNSEQNSETLLNMGLNKYLYYTLGGAVIFSFCLTIVGIYTFFSKIERVTSRNKGLHWIIWGVGILFAVIVIQVLFFVTPILS